jgi:uncharacterized protein DUF4190
MTTSPADGPSTPGADPGGADHPPEPAATEPISFDKPAPAEQPFDPYRFGAPEHPVPPEYAPPGYTPPPPTTPPPYASSPYGPANPGTGYGPAGYPPPGYPSPGYPSPGYQAPVPPGYALQYPQPRTGNGKAIAALVLGILAIVFCWTSIFDVVFVALAVIFGILGLNDAKRGGGGRGLAVSGLVCAVVGALLATILSVVIYSRIRPCLDVYDRHDTSQYNACIRDRF